MNWTALVYGGPMLMILIWWVVSARKWFKGPKVNVEHLMLGRGENVVFGKDGDVKGSGEGSVGSKGGEGEGKMGEIVG
jgi:hypothetical protein